MNGSEPAEAHAEERPLPKGLITPIVALSLLANAVEPIVVKLGFQQRASAVDLLFMKGMAGALCVLLLALLLPKVIKAKWIGWKALGKLAPVCALFFFINWMIFLALRDLSAIALITLITTTPAFVALVNQARKRLVLGLRFWLGFGLCFTGVLLTMDVFQATSTSISALGIGFALLAITGSTTYRTRMDDITQNYPTGLLSFYVFLANGLLACLLLPWVNPASCRHSLPTGLWLGSAALVANLAFLAAIKYLGSTRISIIGTLQRPIVIVASAIVLREKLGWTQILGVIMVILGIWQARPKARIQRP